MGIGVHELALLELEQPLGEVLMLGRQRLNLPKVKGPFADDMLRELGATSVDALDYSDFEGATVIGDLNRPIEVGRQFDTVIDFGTSEHVFDIAASLENCIRLCRTGGKILHTQPADGDCGHGFYQVSPELFLALYAERNGFTGTAVYLYDLFDDRYWWRVAPKGPGNRFQANSLSTAYVMARTTKAREVERLEVAQDFYEAAWEAGAELKVGGRFDRVTAALQHAAPLRQLLVGLYRGFLAPTALTRFNPNLVKEKLPDQAARISHGMWSQDRPSPGDGPRGRRPSARAAARRS